jgi:RimJ/RimL family protein N-acetyltransferase
MAFIETSRLILRTWMPQDLDAWFAIAIKPEVWRYLHRDAPPSRNDVRTWLERQIEEQDREGFSCWPVVRKDDGALMGRCGLHRAPEAGIEIAWAFDPSSWGHGYASESAQAALQFAFGALNLPAVCALVDPRNARSIALINRLHMRFTGLVRAYRRDVLRYDLRAPN